MWRERKLECLCGLVVHLHNKEALPSERSQSLKVQSTVCPNPEWSCQAGPHGMKHLSIGSVRFRPSAQAETGEARMVGVKWSLL